MRVLIVEDDDFAADVLENALSRFGYEVTKARNGREALELVRSSLYRLVISDWEMPEISGVDLCRRIRAQHTGGYVYIILLTARRGTKHVVEGLNAGADDFITKPFEPQELLVRLRAGERILALESRELIIFSLAKLAESRDPDTGAHLERMREYCRVLAEHLSRQEKFRDQVDGNYIQLIYLTSPLHDIGKVGIPDSVLLKPGKFTPEEFEIMKQHALIGFQTLDAAARTHPDARFLLMAREIAISHHERFDGSGYPNHLVGEAIPLCSRIVALADVYDALTTKRIYKPAYSHEEARAIIFGEMLNKFDPEILEAFCQNEERFMKIKAQFTDQEHPTGRMNGQSQTPDPQGNSPFCPILTVGTPDAPITS
ncbi:MAG: response regulator [Pirellulales bacterium]|nr:response regulator [Pirellulales bacterium]